MAFLRKRRVGKDDHWDACWHDTHDGKRKQRSRTFDSKKEASKFLETIGIRKPNTHAPFKTLADAFTREFENTVKTKVREESTLRQLRQHINLHIMPDAEFSLLKCDEIGTPEVQLFLDRLSRRVSPVMAGKVRTTLSQIFAFGARRGYVASNPVRDSKVTRTDRSEEGEAGEKFILPPENDLKRLLEAARTFDNTGRADAIVRTLMHAGLRASELRGLPIRALSFEIAQPKLRVDQRADRFEEIGPTKSKNSRRDIVLGLKTVKAIKTWLETAPRSEFVFPNADGNIQSYSNLWNRFWVPLMNHAGLVTDEPASATIRNWSAAQGSLMKPRFGLHMLRHVFASLQIRQGVKHKQLQALMGHATLKLTMDTYGHLWPSDDDDKLAANVENVLG